MEELLIEFFKMYGWRLTLIACSGIFILGFLKTIHVFDKVNKENRKYIFGAISSAISIGAAALYLILIHTFNWVEFGVTAGMIYGLNQAIYSIYETWGFRKLLQKFGSVARRIVKVIFKKDIKEIPAVEELEDSVLTNDDKRTNKGIPLD